MPPKGDGSGDGDKGGRRGCVAGSPTSPPPNPEHKKQETEWGILQGGCFGQARRAVADGGPAFDTSLAEKLGGQAWFQSDEDSRVEAAYESWSHCMSGEVFTYRTSREANNDAHWSGPQPTDAEIVVALADVRCKKETNLVGIRMAVETAYQRLLIREHSEDMQRLMEGRERQLRNSTELLGAIR